MDKHRGLLHIRRMDRVRNALIKELCGGIDERIDEGVLRWRKWRTIRLLKESV